MGLKRKKLGISQHVSEYAYKIATSGYTRIALSIMVTSVVLYYILTQKVYEAVKELQ